MLVSKHLKIQRETETREAFMVAIKVYPKKNMFFKDKLCLDIFIYYLGKIPNVDEKSI